MINAEKRADWQFKYANFWLTGGNLVILLFGFHVGSPLGWRIALVLLAAASVWAWLANLRRYRTVADTATTRIATAPQGYIEISGVGKHPPGDRLISPASKKPCLWYRYRIERKRGDKWVRVDSGSSHDTFAVDDGTGQMLVDPEGAEIHTSHTETRGDRQYRITEWLLIPNDRIYVIGEHATLGGAHAALDKKQDISALLAEWKRDKTTLLARFDADRDGEISLEEWEAARKAAADEVDRTHLDTRLQESVHLIRKPGHRRPYLIANRDIEGVARRYRRWSGFHLVVIVCTLVALAML
ncbi:MAG: E3 ubiquitin ligase family protein [Thiobacillus sp.]|nr:E3 ubiquitin ligase family protein [Thiobacillus sp.]